MLSTSSTPESPDTVGAQLDAALSPLARYRSVRQVSFEICSPLSAEDHSLQPMPDASPAKWHLAHTTWFFETFLLSEHLPGYRVFHPAFRNLFNSYYNAIGDRPQRALRHVLSRPGLDEVRSYREHVDEGMAQLLELELTGGVLDMVLLGLNHEQQHQELIITDVKNGLWANPLRPAYRDPSEVVTLKSEAPLRWRNFEGGVHAVGFEGEGFAFDNERPGHNVYLEPFQVASRLVTNEEYLDFMRDDGYGNPKLWLSDGWDCARNNQWNAPLYWEQRDGEWWNYSIEGMKPVDGSEPVCHVSYYEADAFAHWAGARLATEFEWEAVSATCAVQGNFLESGSLHPRSSDQIEPLTQMFGDVWEWTASPYVPYPGFKTAPGAVGEYNGKFMCNQMVLRGGSCATPQSHIRCTYRNFFPPHARWQFMGIRLANGN
jgi:ergothioneine biosynthesis protein EgtB